MKAKTIKYLQENVGQWLCNDNVEKILPIKEKLPSWTSSISKLLFERVKKMKRQPPTGKNSPYMYLTKDMYPEYIKNYHNLMLKSHTTQLLK